MKPYYSYKDFLTNQFGARIQKLAIDAGFTCPNRDGNVGLNGCSYCDNRAFKPSYCTNLKPVKQQLEEGIIFHKNRYRRADAYLAYFQAFSNSYASLDELIQIYQPAIEHAEIKGIVIGTRPDCLEEKKLDYFAELAQKMFVSIEIGIESIHDETLRRINRGHNFQCAVDCLKKMKERNLHAGAHFIFGLPGEIPEMWIEDVKTINNLNLSSIKFHQLQIIKGTAMECEYEENPTHFFPFTMESYIEFIIDFVERLNPCFAIERFAGEVPLRYLAVNNWGTIRYDVVLQRIIKEFIKRDTWQGKYM
ncbi:MAG: TIGR01212 family radical SAM protein [Bacteroidales bacterium]|nr:TIGR01212 family radical SAM protein [Bacteroidales bacterium]